MIKNKTIIDSIIEMPKAEIHLHLEGAFTLDSYSNLFASMGVILRLLVLKILEKSLSLKIFHILFKPGYGKINFSGSRMIMKNLLTRR